MNSHYPSPRPAPPATGRRWSAVLLVGLAAAMATTWAPNTRATPDEATGGTLLLPSAAGGPPQPAPLLATRVDIDIVAMTARVKVAQRFANPGTQWSEGVYVFPLPDTAAVDRLRMRVGERVIEGEIQEKTQARATYRKARDAGQRSSLVEQQRPNIFTTSVANIDPHGEVQVTIEYQQQVAYRDGRFRLRFPMVVGPRYIPGKPIREQLRVAGGWAADTDQVPDASRITPPVADPGSPTADSEARNPVELRVRLEPGMPLADLASSYHPVRIEHRDPVYRVALQQGPVPAERDFELVWTPQPDRAPRAALFTEQRAGQTYALLMLVPPLSGAVDQADGADQDRPAAPPTRDLTLVIDTSGSMHGDSIIQARNALLLALKGLRPGDRFNVIEFNNQPRRLFPGLADATPANRAQAASWVQALQADGGTEMAAALDLALGAGQKGSGRLHQVVFVTDGAVGNEAALFRLISDRLGDSRLFTVGIGSAPNSHFMRKAAAAGRGTFTHIGKPSEVLEKMGALLRKLQNPALTDLQLELPPGLQAEVYPDPLPDLYLGEPVQLALRVDRLPPNLVVSGHFGDRPWRSELRLDGPQPGNGISVLWARRRITGLMDQLNQTRQAEPRAALREAVVQTALGHHLVSPYTSLVAVDKTPARPLDEPLRQNTLKTRLPQGWSYGKVFGMARTATPAALQLLIGALLLAAALLLGWRARRPVTPA